MTERQAYIVKLAREGHSLDEIGKKYQQRFKTKSQLPRERVRDILAQFGEWPRR